MKNNCCKEGCSLPSSNNEYNILLENLKREVTKLMNDTTAKLLCQDKKIAELCVYIKNNLSNSIRELLDNMKFTGELDTLINNTVTNLGYIVDDLVSETDKFYIYNPSLLNSVNSESISLVMNSETALLFDTGRDTSVTENINYLNSKLCGRKIDAIFISHYHTDHVGGLNSILSLLSPTGTVYLPMNFIDYYNGSDDAEVIINIRQEVIDLLRQNNINYVEVNTDRILNFGEVKVKLLNSNSDAYTYYNEHQSRYNAYSMNALVSIGDNKVLYPGDSLIDTQDYLFSKNQVEKVSIYASAHHGYERKQNSEYLDILNPDYEYFSVSPLSWDDVIMTNYDYTLRNKPVQYTTEAFGEIEYVVTKNSTRMVKGYYAKENMFVTKRLDIYVDPNYSGVPDGSEDSPFRTLSQAISYLPDTETNITIHLKSGIYENVRFTDISNMLQITSDNNDVTFKNLQISNCSAIYFNGIYFIDNVVANYGFVYFSNCRFACSSTSSGNICITLNRINASFGNCEFNVCYTGIYAQSGCQVTSKNCIFDCSGYAIYGMNSYIALDDYTLTNGQLREDTGCTIKTVNRGNSTNVPNFNNSNYMRGYEYFATNLGYPLFYFNDGGVDHWKKADGTIEI